MTENAKGCASCQAWRVAPSAIHVRRVCPDCGRPIFIPPGPMGLGVARGDQVVVPAGELRLSLDRALSSGRFTRYGLRWFVQQLLFDPALAPLTELDQHLAAYESRAQEVLAGSSLLVGLDPDRSPADEQEAFNRLQSRPDLPEHWAGQLSGFTVAAREALENQEVRLAAWLMHGVAKASAMLTFVESLEELVWQGYETYGLGALTKVLEEWNANQDNTDEDFWQTMFDKYPFIVSQVLSHPVVVAQGKAYVGGKTFRDQGGEIVDLLLSNQLTGNIALLELKTPGTRLTGRKYRGVFPPSVDLSGAVAQVVSQRDKLVRSSSHLLDAATTPPLSAFNPHCVVLAGHTCQLDSEVKRRGFELFRSHLVGITVMTYDELFHNVEILLTVVRGSP
jgi:hypothetical protein